VPTLSTVLGHLGGAHLDVATETIKENSGKFTPVSLSDLFNASPLDFGPRDRARGLSGYPPHIGLLKTPAGKDVCRGVPFWFGPEGAQTKRWVAVSDQPSPWATKRVEISLSGLASYICLAAFCDFDPNETPPPGIDVMEQVGQHLAELVLVFRGGITRTLPIRRRFEVDSPSPSWGQGSFGCVPYASETSADFLDPIRRGAQWGDVQTGVIPYYANPTPDGRPIALVWLTALRNPEPALPLEALHLKAKSDAALMVCALTLFHGRDNPLRSLPLALYRLTLPDSLDDMTRWEVSVDLGVVARAFALPEFAPEKWLLEPGKSLGGRDKRVPGNRYLYVEVAANADATLYVRDTRRNLQYEFELGNVIPGKELEARSGSARVEVLQPRKVWAHAQVIDKEMGKPTPARLSFRSAEGRYIPPYGHRTEINDAWFQDYGADVKVMDSPFAYVDGTFQIELPLGDVFVEISKGFEYEPLRQKLLITEGQRDLRLEISRFANLRAEGWVTADTHTHFLSPTTAVLEGQAEGLNLINLLAAQWGDLFTNVGDLPFGPLTSQDRDTVVWVGSENRQHILGHISLLGGHNPPVFPLSTGGPEEAYFGGPLRTLLAQWGDACRQRQGLVVAPHFPFPTGEIAADIALGKIDAVEIWPMYKEHFNSLRYLDWYRYLNCGYRLPAVGGTDKMGAYMPAGTNRAYAFLGGQEFNFDNWAKAVRSGNTFVTSGPLLDLKVDGRSPGEEITLSPKGGTVEVHAEAKCFVPVHRLEIILNGQVVACRDEAGGVRALTLREKLSVPGAGWLAARCSSRLGPVTSWQFRISAHTSPVYLSVPGAELFSASTVAYMLTLIDGAEYWVENMATLPSEEDMTRIRKTFNEARTRLHERLHRDRVPH